MQLPIDDVVQYAHDFNLRESMSPDLRPSISALFRELDDKRVDHVLVGGVALLSYVEGRNTQGIDFIVRTDQLDAIDWQAVVQDRDFGRARYRGVRIDLLLSHNPLFAHVAANERTSVEFQGRRISIATRKGLLLLKLYALPSLYRQGKLARAALYEADIRMLHQGADVDDRELLGVLGPHLSTTDVAELGRIREEQKATRRF